MATFAGAIYSYAGPSAITRPVLTNCVLFCNGGANAIVTSPSAVVTASYSLFEASVTDFTDGGNNLTSVTTSPFASTASTQLSPCSPAINRGSNLSYTSASGPTTDLAGNPRFFNGGQVDMGACEYQGATTITVGITPTPSLTIGVGQSATLTASGGTSYSWSSGESTTAISVSVAGTYSVTGTTGSCSGTASVVLSVTVCGAGVSGPTWTGCVSRDWNTAGNWASGTVPTAADDAVIPSAPANQPIISTTAVASERGLRSVSAAWGV